MLIAGVTTRALALSAARAGYCVTAIDAFGDLDLRAAARVLMLPMDHRRFFPAAAAKLAAGVNAELAAYTSNFENYPHAVDCLQRGRHLLGNPAAVLRRARDPLALARALRTRRLPAPITRGSAPAGHASSRDWLLKPRRSGGGHGTKIWRRSMVVSRRAYLQERIAGVPGSVIFAADGRRCLVLGLSRQLVGERAFGAGGFRYCGSFWGSGDAPLFELESSLAAAAATIAAAMTEEFQLRGLNGIDFIARDGTPYPIEINPRYSASMELIERSAPISVFELHRQACEGRLPQAVEAGPRMVWGKAVVFARRRVTVGELPFDADSIADVPRPGTRIARGRPICTVFAKRQDADRCRRALEKRAAAVYRVLETGVRGAA